MKSTLVCAARAVRMYVPTQPVPAPASSSTLPAAEVPTPAEVRTARRVTDTILRARATRKQQQQKGHSQTTANPVPLPPPPPLPSKVIPISADEKREAMRLALSYGKTALLTHLAHQQDDTLAQLPYAYSTVDWAHIMGEAAEEASTASATRGSSAGVRHSTADDGVAALRLEVAQTWGRLRNEAKVRWIASTPQGRRALRHAMGSPAWEKGCAEAASTSASGAAATSRVVVPTMQQMLTKYADTLVRPRQPRSAALTPEPPQRYLHDLFADEVDAPTRTTTTTTAVGGSDGDALLHFGSAAESANRASLRAKADAARETERKKAWLHDLAQSLGGDNAVKFVNDVKALQRPRDDGGEYESRTASPGAAANTSSAESSREAIYSSGVLELCQDLGIRSPRRAYVMTRVLPQVDEAAATSQPLTLDQVRELAIAYAAEYDSELKTIAADAEKAGEETAAEAVRNFERFQLELVVDKVQVKLSKFQDNVPLLRNCTNVFNK